MSNLFQAADPASSGGFDVAVLAQYGVLGIFAILLVVFANSTYRREITRADRLETEVLRLNALIQDKHIPALEAAAHALKEANEVMRDLQRDRERAWELQSRRRESPRRE